LNGSHVDRTGNKVISCASSDPIRGTATARKERVDLPSTDGSALRHMPIRSLSA